MFLASLFRDMSGAVRQMRRLPGLTVLQIASIGLALATNISFFVMLNATWFRPWDVEQPERVRIVSPRVTADAWQFLSERTNAFEQLAAVGDGPFLRWGGQAVPNVQVSSNYFSALGIPLAQGRAFGRRYDDVLSGESIPAVISDRFWRQRLGSRPDAVGQTLTMTLAAAWQDQVSIMIVGVAAAGFDGPETPRVQAWLPLAARRAPAFGNTSGGVAPPTLNVFGRLRPGVSNAVAATELAGLVVQYGGAVDDRDSVLVRPTDRFSRAAPSAQAQSTLLVLMLGIMWLTLVACANVANLQLARGYSRRGELAVRLSLGATRGAIVRQLTTEALAVAALSTIFGLAAARWLPAFLMNKLLERASPGLAEMFRVDFPIDARVLSWALLVGAVVGIAFGLLPALQVSSGALVKGLRDTHSGSTRRLKSSLLGYQCTVSVMTLLVAGLVMRSEELARARGMEARLRELLIISIDSAPQDAARRFAINEILWQWLSGRVAPVALAASSQGERKAGSRILESRVSRDYFAVLGLPIVVGRGFDDNDSGRRAVVVNEACYSRYWPGRRTVGAVFTPRLAGDEIPAALVGNEVIGVVQDRGVRAEAGCVAYRLGSSADYGVFLVRDPTRTVYRELGTFLEATIPGARARLATGVEWAGGAAGPLLFAATAVGAFGLCSILLGALGVFTMVEYTVRTQTRELGLRFALGARSKDVMLAALRPTAIALVRGVAFGALTAGIVGWQMWSVQLPPGVRLWDPALYASVIVGVLLVGAVAAYAPAKRVTRTSPIEALRVE